MRAARRPSSGAHQRRTANPIWLSNWVMYAGTGSGEPSFRHSSNSARATGPAKLVCTWWSTSGADSASISSSGTPASPVAKAGRSPADISS